MYQDDIRGLFLAYFKEGNEVWAPLYTETDREHFDKRTASLVADANDLIPLSLIIESLSRLHPSKANIIHSMSPILDILIMAYASFPFSTPVILTKDAFCRAVLLLTERSWPCFKQAWKRSTQQGVKTIIRSRSVEKQLSFLYSTLVRPPIGAPTHDDVLDVLCRVRYPCNIRTGRLHDSKTTKRPPDTKFMPLAERLEPTKDAQPLALLPFSQIQLLQNFVAAFTPPYIKRVAYSGFADSDSIDKDQFIEWAKEVCEDIEEETLQMVSACANIGQVELLLCLDQLFGVFLPPPPWNH